MHCFCALLISVLRILSRLMVSQLLPQLPRHHHHHHMLSLSLKRSVWPRPPYLRPGLCSDQFHMLPSSYGCAMWLLHMLFLTRCCIHHNWRNDHFFFQPMDHSCSRCILGVDGAQRKHSMGLPACILGCLSYGHNCTVLWLVSYLYQFMLLNFLRESFVAVWFLTRHLFY